MSDSASFFSAQANEAITAGNISKAADLLRKASSIDPDNEVVKKQWLNLLARESGGDAVVQVRDYVAATYVDGDSKGEKALQALKQTQLSNVEAAEVYTLLIEAASNDPKPPLLDQKLGTLLNLHDAARRLVARDLSSDPTAVFDSVFPVGDESFRALTAVALDTSAWSSVDAQKAAQCDFFRLCTAKLMEAAVTHPERALRAMSRQLSSQPENVSSLIDENVVDVILSALDIRLEAAVRSQALLATSKLLEVTKEGGEFLFAEFVKERVSRQRNSDLIQAFSAAAAVFPILPTVSAQLFLTEGFVQQLVPTLERNYLPTPGGKSEMKISSQHLQQSALELLSAACVDKACRETINRYCAEWLCTVASGPDSVHNALAALVLAKINEEGVGDITTMLSKIVVGGEGTDGARGQAIEGLAYTTLHPNVKEEVAKDTSLLKMLIKDLNDKSSAAFGVLTVFANLTAYKPVVTEEQKKMSDLKAYANSSKPAPDSALNDDAHVTARCKKLLDLDIVPAVVAACKTTTSPTTVALAVRILLSLSKEKKHRSKMAQQGAVRLLLAVRDRTAKTDKSTSEALVIERSAAHALARILISVNPTHVFSAAVPASSAVGALIPLLSKDEESETRDLLPTFEALLALTNLASMDDDSARELLIRSASSQIEDLLFSANTLVQRATVELVCNLMASPSCIALFASSTSKDSQRRLQVLCALTDVEDLATRRAAGGALAMLTEWDVSVSAVLDMKENKGVKNILGMCGDESDEVKHRGLVCVGNVVSAPGEVGKRGLRAVKEAGGKEKVVQGLKGVKTKEVLEVGLEVLKKLV